MKNPNRSKANDREVIQRKRAARKKTVASISRRYLEVQRLRDRLLVAEHARASVQ